MKEAGSTRAGALELWLASFPQYPSRRGPRIGLQRSLADSLSCGQALLPALARRCSFKSSLVAEVRALLVAAL